MFGEKMKLSCIAEVPQSHRCLRLILKLSEKLDVGKPIVNNSINREAPPESLQFGRAFPRILQAFWEADLAQGPVWVSKLDVIDAYHRGTVTPLQVGVFSYVFPLEPVDEGCIICINLVLSMG